MFFVVLVCATGLYAESGAVLSSLWQKQLNVKPNMITSIGVFVNSKEISNINVSEGSTPIYLEITDDGQIRFMTESNEIYLPEDCSRLFAYF